MRRAAKRDSNEAQIVELFKAHGCEVERINLEGWPDLLVTWGRVLDGIWQPNRALKLALVEVKTRTGKVKAHQEAFARRFAVWVVRCDDDVQQVVQWLKA